MDRYISTAALRAAALGLGLLITVLAVQGCGGGKAQTAAVDQLAASEGSGKLPDLQSMLDSELLRLGVDTTRSGSIAPSAGNAVFDLQASLTTITPGEEAAVQLRWTERLIGDYDQNGLVNASDLTPLAQHFGESVSYRSAVDTEGIEGWPSGLSYAPNDAANWRLARIDGNMDGVINAADVTPIAQHWQQSLSGYRVYRRLEGETAAEMLSDPGDAAAPLSIRRDSLYPEGGSPDNTKPLSYSFSDTLTDAGQYLYYVAAYDPASDGEGPAGKPVHPRLNALPTAVLSADPLTGEAPLVVSLDAGDSSDLDGTIVSYEFDLDGNGSYEQSGMDPDAVSTYNGGSYTIGLRVTDDFGASDTTELAINVNDAIVPVITTSKTTAQLPVDFQLSAADSVIGSPLASCDWYINDNPVPAQSTPQLADFAPQFSATGYYRVRLVLTGEDGLARSAGISLRVVNELPIIPIITADTSISELPAQFNLSAADSVLGSALAGCEWFVNADPLPAQSSSTLEPFSFQPQFTGFYVIRLVLTSSSGTPYETSISLQAYDANDTVPVVTANAIEDSIPVNFVLTSSQSILVNPLVSCEWFIGNSQIPEQTTPDLADFVPIINAPGIVQIRLRLTDDQGGSWETFQPLLVYAAPQAVISDGADRFWDEDFASLSAAQSPGEGLSYAWDIDASWISGSDNSVFEEDMLGSDISFQVKTPEVFAVILRVTDRFGKSSDSSHAFTAYKIPSLGLWDFDDTYKDQGNEYYEDQTGRFDMVVYNGDWEDTITGWQVEFPGSSKPTLSGAMNLDVFQANIHWLEPGSFQLRFTALQNVSALTPPSLIWEYTIPVLAFHPVLESAEWSPPAGLDVTLDGSASVSELPLVGYSWDFDNDGITDQAGLDNIVTHTFPPGNYHVTFGMHAQNGYSRYASGNVSTFGEEVVIIRNDGHLYDANYDAITADLDAIPVPWSVIDYYPGIAADESTSNNLTYIWYRGGPGSAAEPAPYTTMWSTDEIDDYLAFMNNGKSLLLMSQSHGKDPDKLLEPSLWETGLGIIPLPNSIPIAEVRHPWALGLPTDLGIGFGGEQGWLPMCPQNLSDNNFHDCHYAADGAYAASRYKGEGSSGRFPIQIRINESFQLCGIGFYQAFWGSQAPGFTGGFNCERIQGQDLAFLSYGNANAPDSNIGFFPSYNHVSGPARLWVVGYPWAQTEITSAFSYPDGLPTVMTRADMLHNILGWLIVDKLP